MLYLVRSKERFKIGYTTNLVKRMNTYSTHNPDVKLLAFKEGSKEEEKELHNKYKKYLIKNSEWMDIPKEEILDFIREFDKNAICGTHVVFDSDTILDLMKLEGKLIDLFLFIAFGQELSLFDTDKDGYFYNNKTFKMQVKSWANFSDSCINNYISRLYKYGQLIKSPEKGLYKINPKYLGNERVINISKK